MPNKVTTIGGRLLQSDLILDNVRFKGDRQEHLHMKNADNAGAAVLIRPFQVRRASRRYTMPTAALNRKPMTAAPAVISVNRVPGSP